MEKWSTHCRTQEVRERNSLFSKLQCSPSVITMSQNITRKYLDDLALDCHRSRDEAACQPRELSGPSTISSEVVVTPHDLGLLSGGQLAVWAAG